MGRDDERACRTTVRVSISTWWAECSNGGEYSVGVGKEDGSFSLRAINEAVRLDLNCDDLRRGGFLEGTNSLGGSSETEVGEIGTWSCVSSESESSSVSPNDRNGSLAMTSSRGGESAREQSLNEGEVQVEDEGDKTDCIDDDRDMVSGEGANFRLASRDSNDLYGLPGA